MESFLNARDFAVDEHGWSVSDDLQRILDDPGQRSVLLSTHYNCNVVSRVLIFLGLREEMKHVSMVVSCVAKKLIGLSNFIAADDNTTAHVNAGFQSGAFKHVLFLAKEYGGKEHVRTGIYYVARDSNLPVYFIGWNSKSKCVDICLDESFSAAEVQQYETWTDFVHKGGFVRRYQSALQYLQPEDSIHVSANLRDRERIAQGKDDVELEWLERNDYFKEFNSQAIAHVAGIVVPWIAGAVLLLIVIVWLLRTWYRSRSRK